MRIIKIGENMLFVESFNKYAYMKIYSMILAYFLFGKGVGSGVFYDIIIIVCIHI